MAKDSGINFSLNFDKSGYDLVEKNLPKVIEDALYAMGVDALGGAVSSISGRYMPDNLAVDTGRLRASLSFITEDREGSSGESSSAEQPGDKLTGKGEKDCVIVGTNVEYAEYVHNGTSKMTGRPFLREGIDQTRDMMREHVEEILKRGI